MQLLEGGSSKVLKPYSMSRSNDVRIPVGGPAADRCWGQDDILFSGKYMPAFEKSQGELSLLTLGLNWYSGAKFAHACVCHGRKKPAGFLKVHGSIT